MCYLVTFPFFFSQVFLPGFLSSNLYYKYLNDLIHSVRGDEFAGGSIALTIHGPSSIHDNDSHMGTMDSASSSSSQVHACFLVFFSKGSIVLVGLSNSCSETGPSAFSPSVSIVPYLWCWETFVGRTGPYRRSTETVASGRGTQWGTHLCSPACIPASCIWKRGGE